LVDSWEVSEDGFSTTIHLVEGITYSDGVAVNASVAASYIEWFASTPELAPWFGTTNFLTSAEALDERNVRITTEIPMGRSFVMADGLFMVLNSLAVWGDISGGELFTFQGFPPVGTGPYTVEEWEPGSYVIYEAREDYQREKPPIDRLIQQIFANPDALVSALLAGEIDLTQPRMPPETYDILVSAPNVTVEERVATEKYNLNFNMSPFGVRHPAVADLAVREAIDYAIDRQAIIDIALLGHGALCPTNWACAPNMVDQINPDLVVTPYDPAKANQILDEAGYTDIDGDGIRETADGLPLDFRLFYELEDPPQLTVSDMLSGYLAEIGIAVDVQALEHGEMVQGVLSERDFELVLFNMYTDMHGPGGMDYTGSCWAADAGPNGRNYPGYCNEDLDNLVYEAWYTLDEDVFYDSLYEAQALVAQERPYITIAGVNKIQAFRDDRFEFPFGICHELEGGMFSYMGIMNAVVK
jgi:peptide/nickel transport system substrate-binding protein